MADITGSVSLKPAGPYTDGQTLTVAVTLDRAPKKTARHFMVQCDLFRESPRITVGRYKHTGSAQVTLHGMGSAPVTVTNEEGTVRLTGTPIPLTVAELEVSLAPATGWSPAPSAADGTYEVGQAVTVKATLSKAAPDTATASVACPAFEAGGPLKFRKGATEATTKVTIAKGASGDQTATLSPSTGCVTGAVTTADFKVKAPAFEVDFAEGDGWIEPQRESGFCEGDKATIHLAAPADPPAGGGPHASVKVGSATAVPVTFSGRSADVSVTFAEFNKKTKVVIEPPAGASWKAKSRTVAVHQKNKVSLGKPTEKGPFYKGDRIKLPVRLKYRPEQGALDAQPQGAVAKLKSAILGQDAAGAPKTVDVTFTAGQTEQTVELEVVDPGTAETATVELISATTDPANSLFRIDDAKNRVTVRVSPAVEISFAGPPDPAGPYIEGDTATFTVGIPHAPIQNDTGVVLRAATRDEHGVPWEAFAEQPIEFKPNTTEIEVPVTFKEARTDTTVDAKLEPLSTSGTASPQPYSVSATNGAHSITVVPKPKVRFAAADPVPGRQKNAGGNFDASVGEEVTVAVSLEGAVPAGTMKAKLVSADLDMTEADREIVFEGGASTVQKAVRFKAGPTQTELKVEGVERCDAAAAPGDTLTFELGDATKVSLAAGEGWATPAGPYRVGQKVTVHLVLAGKKPVAGNPPAPAPVKVQLTSEAFKDDQHADGVLSFDIPASAWDDPARKGSVDVYMTKRKALRQLRKDPEMELALAPAAAGATAPPVVELGDHVRTTIVVKKAKTAYFTAFAPLKWKWTDPKGSHYSRERFKVQVDLSHAAEEAGELVKLVVPDPSPPAAPPPPPPPAPPPPRPTLPVVIHDADGTTRDDGLVHFEAGSTQALVELSIEKDGLAANETVQLKLEALEESGVTLGKDVTVPVDIAPDPIAYFDDATTPFMEETSGTPPTTATEKVAPVGKKATVGVLLEGRMPSGGAKARIASPAFGQGEDGQPKTYEVAFAPDSPRAEVEIELAVPTIAQPAPPPPTGSPPPPTGSSPPPPPSTTDITLEGAQGTRVDVPPNPAHPAVWTGKIKDGSLDLAGPGKSKNAAGRSVFRSWISPFYSCFAKEDQVWIRVKRNVRAEKLDEERNDASIPATRALATISSPAFGWVDPNSRAPGAVGSPPPPPTGVYPVVFRKGEAWSEIVVPPAGDPACPPGNATGLLLQVASDLPQKVTVTPNQDGIDAGLIPGSLASRDILVKDVRGIHFPPGLYDEPLDVLVGEEKKIRLASTVPSLRKNEVVLEGPAFGSTGAYKARFRKGAVGTSCVVKFTVPSAPDTPHEISMLTRPRLGHASPLRNVPGYMSVISVNVRRPQVSFDPDHPFKPPITTEKGVAAVVGLDAKAVLNLVLSDPAPEGMKVKITCPSFPTTGQGAQSFQGYEVEFEKGARSKEVEVHFANPTPTSTPPNDIVEVHLTSVAPWDPAPDPEAGGPGRVLKVKVAAEPAMRFPFPLLVGDREEEATGRAIADLFRTDGEEEAAQPVIRDDERARWIVPYGLPFVVGEKAKIRVHLSHVSSPPPTKPAIGYLTCPCFARDVKVEIPAGQTELDVEVEFAKSLAAPTQAITLEGKDRCVTGTEFVRMVQVYADRPVYFPPRQTMEPLGPFVEGDGATLKVCLKHPAVGQGVKAKLTGPFADREIAFEEGQLHAFARVTFTGDDPAEQTIEISPVSGCGGGNKTTHPVTVYKPKAAFADPAFEDLDSVMPGGRAELRLKLDKPAPIQGCTVKLTSPIFPKKPDDPSQIISYEVRFPKGETEVVVPVDIEPEPTFPVPGNQDIHVEGIGRAATDRATLSVEVNKGPTAGFADAASPLGQVFEEGAQHTLRIELSAAPAEDEQLRLESTAFGNTAYVVKMPKGRSSTLSQRVTFVNGKEPDAAGKVEMQRIRLIPPKGWVADQKFDDEGGRKTPDLQVKVKIPDPANQPLPCQRAEDEFREWIRALALEAGEEGDEPDLDQPCNLNAMYVTVRHGSPHGDNGRGADGKGTFEIVRDKGVAKEPSKALVCTSRRTPILQVTAGREFGDPHVANLDGSVHSTIVAVRFHADNKYCGRQFVFGETEPVQHPVVRVVERTKGKMGKREAKVRAKADAAQLKYDQVMQKPRALKASVQHKRGEIDAAIAREVDGIVDLYEEFETGLVAKVTEPLKRVGDSLGLEREVEAPPEAQEQSGPPPPPKPRRKWSERYDWWPVDIPGVRPAVDEKLDPLFEIPLHQANQVWHEIPKPENGESIGLAELSPISVSAGGPDGGKKAGFGLVRDLMSALSFAAMAPRQYLISSESCGSPDVATGRGPVDELRVIVEVYPSDEFCLNYEFKSNLGKTSIGKEGTFFTPTKGIGDQGLKDSSPPPDEAAADEVEPLTEEEEEKAPVLSTQFAWVQAEEDEEEAEDEAPEEEADDPGEYFQWTEQPGGNALEVGDDGTGGERARFLFEADYHSAEKPPAVKPEPGQEHTPTRVFHPFGEEVPAEDPAASKTLLGQFLAYATTDPEPIMSGTLDLDAATEGSISKTQAFLDDTLFSITDYGVTLTRNGQTGPFYYGITKTIGASIATIRSIATVFNDLSASCTQSFGWGFQFDIAFLEGNLSLYWGWKEYEDHRVFKWYSLQLKLTLMKVSVTVYVGFSATALMLKFQAILYGTIGIEAGLEAGFERQHPDTVTPEWLDTWITCAGKATLGARVVLIHENVFIVDAAIKTGYELKFRITPGLLDRFGVEYQIFWLGVTAGARFKAAGFKEKKREIAVVEGNPPELPWRRGAFPQAAATSWSNVHKIVNLAWSRASYQRRRILSLLNAYQSLKLEMVSASVRNPDRYPYTDQLPGHRPKGWENGTGADERRQREAAKDKFNRQWEECLEAFTAESGTAAATRYIHRSVNLTERLHHYVEKIDGIWTSHLEPRLAQLDGLMDEIMSLDDEIAQLEADADEGVGAPPELLERARTLSRHKELTRSERVGKRPQYRMKKSLSYLRYYAAMRQEW